MMQISSIPQQKKTETLYKESYKMENGVKLGYYPFSQISLKIIHLGRQYSEGKHWLCQAETEIVNEEKDLGLET